MESKVGSVFLIVSAVIEFVISFFAFVASFVALGFNSYVFEGIQLGIISFLILFLVGLFFLFLGLVYLLISRKMNSPRSVLPASIWAILVGIITSWSFAGLFSIVGGIIGLVEYSR